MDNNEDVKQWFKEMGYFGTMPSNMNSLVSRSTTHLWNDIIQTIRPKYEVKKIVTNIVLNRLNNPSLTNQNDASSITQIETIRKKQELQMKLKQLHETVKIKHEKLKKVKDKCYTAEFELFNIQKQMTDLKRRIFLINAKNTELKKQISSALNAQHIMELSTTIDRNKLAYNLQIDTIKSYGEVPPIENQRKIYNSEQSLTAVTMQKLFNETIMDSSQSIIISNDEIKHSTHNATEWYFDMNQTLQMYSTDISNEKAEFKKVLLNKSNDDMADSICDRFQRLLQIYHGNAIYLTITTNIKDVFQELVMYVNKKGIRFPTAPSISKDITKLQFLHVRNEIIIINQNEIISNLISKINKEKLRILDSVCPTNPDKLENWLELKISNKSEQITNEILLSELYNSPVTTTKKNQAISRTELDMKLNQLKHELNNKTDNLKVLVDKFDEQFDILKMCNQEFKGLLSRMDLIKLNYSNWNELLLSNVLTREIVLFNEFPLEYQRKCTLTHPHTYYRDLFINIYQHNDNWDYGNLKLLSNLLGGPFNPIEKVLLKIVNVKNKLDQLKTMEHFSKGSDYVSKYSYDDLMKQESYIKHSIERCHSIMGSYKTLTIEDVIREMLYIWINMPMKDIISSKRTYDDKTFIYYQNKLNSYE